MGNMHWKEPEPTLFRYSVRCDRERNRAIERAAKRAGMTANQFVQQHFDRILDEPAEIDG